MEYFWQRLSTLASVVADRRSPIDGFSVGVWPADHLRHDSNRMHSVLLDQPVAYGSRTVVHIPPEYSVGRDRRSEWTMPVAVDHKEA